MSSDMKSHGLALGAVAGTFAALALGCATPPSSTTPTEPTRIPFRYVQGHELEIPVTVGSKSTKFILDTGVGLDVISSKLAAEIGATDEKATYTGKRMSGQALTIPLERIPSLTVGTRRRESLVTGVLDMTGWVPLGSGIEGYVGLGFFDSQPFTLDYETSTLILETEASLAERAKTSAAVPVHFERDDRSCVIFIDLVLPGAGAARVEVDTGSGALILDNRYLERLGVHEGAAGVRTSEGKDESGNPYKRLFVKLAGPVGPKAAPDVQGRDLDVMFQAIIHDGLVGDDFLHRFVVTYDLAHERLLFGAKTTHR